MLLLRPDLTEEERYTFQDEHLVFRVADGSLLLLQTANTCHSFISKDCILQGHRACKIPGLLGTPEGKRYHSYGARSDILGISNQRVGHLKLCAFPQQRTLQSQLTDIQNAFVSYAS